jgi:hypothetical protein
MKTMICSEHESMMYSERLINPITYVTRRNMILSTVYMIHNTSIIGLLIIAERWFYNIKTIFYDASTEYQMKVVRPQLRR